MRKIVSLVAIVTALFYAVDRSAAQSTEVSELMRPKAELIVSAPNVSKVGKRINLILQIKNVGKTPFYMTRAIQFVDYHGGFEIVVTPPPGARIDGGSASGDYAGPVDITKEADAFVLLVPGAMYGVTVTAMAVPISPGTYKIVCRRVPPLIPESTKQKLLANLKFPILFDLVESEPQSMAVRE